MADVDAPVIAVCHGGGPMPALRDPGHADLIKSWQTRVPEILGLNDHGRHERRDIKGVVVVTAHWQEHVPTISNAASHPLFYDYSGFPDAAYQIRYDAPGSPEIAAQVHDCLARAGLKPSMDPKRGWDHGVFIPMSIIQPRADLPIVQLSLKDTDSPREHYRVGRALAPLRAQGIAILGSGMPTFHNLRTILGGGALSAKQREDITRRNAAFSERLTRALQIDDAEAMLTELEGWRSWEGATEAHPRGGEEHFWPLIVCAGAAIRAGGEQSVIAADPAASGHVRWWSDMLEVRGWQMEQRSYYWDRAEHGVL